LAYTEILADKRSAIATCFLLRAADWVERSGVTINRVMIDNGNGYRAHLFLNACPSFVAKFIKPKPYTPRTDGKAGRFLLTSPREWAYKQAYDSSAEREAILLP
jgi:transposase InsO family protein